MSKPKPAKKTAKKKISDEELEKVTGGSTGLGSGKMTIGSATGGAGAGKINIGSATGGAGAGIRSK
jgi:bacteriocin-like protein